MDKLGIMIEKLRLRFLRLTRSKRTRAMVEAMGRDIDRHVLEDVSRVLRIPIVQQSVETGALLGRFIRENVDLITSIATTQLDQVERIVREAATSGMRVETLRSRILERFDVSRSRAELIARDQVLKANSNLTQSRHKAAGVSSYVWSTSRDERVRDMHQDLEGQMFTYADPPVTNPQGDANHPGEDYQCRCVAIPVITDLVGPATL